MVDRIFVGFAILELLFVVGGVVLLAFSLMTKNLLNNAPTAQNIARDIVLDMCPLNAAIGNAILIFLTFATSLPAMVLPNTRGWLKLHGYMVVVNIVFTLVIGLAIWFETLKTRSNLGVLFALQDDNRRSLIQQEFQCCGYLNSTSPPFITDPTCPSAAIAAQTRGCVSPFSTFTNNFLDVVFTGAFGIVGVDVVLILATAILAKDRKENARYRVIDEKNGNGI